jgi:hypothetical protein
MKKVIALAFVIAGFASQASAVPYTETCPLDGGTGTLDAGSCSVTNGTAIVCTYTHQPTTGPAHRFYVRVQ